MNTIHDEMSLRTNLSSIGTFKSQIESSMHSPGEKKCHVLVRSGTPEENVVNFLDISLRKVHKKGCYFDDD